jgi:hypothetical protein
MHELDWPLHCTYLAMKIAITLKMVLAIHGSVFTIDAQFATIARSEFALIVSTSCFIEQFVA